MRISKSCLGHSLDERVEATVAAQRIECGIMGEKHHHPHTFVIRIVQRSERAFVVT